MTRQLPLLCIVAALLAAAVAYPRAALAHASLLEATPAEGAVLAAPPEAFHLTFNEPVSPLIFKLAAPDGTVSSLPQPASHDTTLVIAAPTAMREGTYVLSWRVVSLDGHPVGGTISFSVGSASSRPAASLSNVASLPVRIAIWLVRFTLYVGLFFGAGASGYRALIAPLPNPARRLAVALSVLGLAAVPVSIGLQGLDALDAPLGGFFVSAVWKASLGTSYGATAFCAAVALVVGLFALLLTTPRRASLLAGVAFASLGLALAASGHAATASPEWLMRPAVFLHAVAIAFWLGALPPLAFTLRAGGAEAARSLTRFSKRIPYAIAPLIVAGVTLAVTQVGEPSALVSTAYGRVLLAKLALLVLLFGLAAWNRWVLTARAEARDGDPRRRLARATFVEIAIVAAILGVVGLWRFTPPPRALAASSAASVEVHLHGEAAMAQLAMTPGRVGHASALIELWTGEGLPLQAKAVTLVLSRPDSAIEPISREAERNGANTWRVDDLVLPLAGEWTARVEILVTDFEKVRLEAPVEIAP